MSAIRCLELWDIPVKRSQKGKAGEEIEVRASIVNLPGISGHADRDHLTAWIANFKKPPKKVFIVHGEETTAVEFAEHVKNDVGFDALAPYSGDAYDLLTGEQIAQEADSLWRKRHRVFTVQNPARLTA